MRVCRGLFDRYMCLNVFGHTGHFGGYVGALLQMCRALLQIHVGGRTMICVWIYRALVQLYKGSFAEVWASFAVV